MQSNRVQKRVQQAVEWYREDPKCTFREAAAKFNVASLSVSDAHHGRYTRSIQLHSNAKLSVHQERALEKHILGLQQQLRPIHYPELRIVVNALVEENATTERPYKPLGINWITKFIARHPDLRLRQEQHLEIERISASLPSLLKAWFSSVKVLLSEIEFDDADV